MNKRCTRFKLQLVFAIYYTVFNCWQNERYNILNLNFNKCFRNVSEGIFFKY